MIPNEYFVLLYKSVLIILMYMQDEIYLCVGRLIALSILHGGPGPTFFANVVIDYLFSGITTITPTIQDVPDTEVQLKIKKARIWQNQLKISCNFWGLLSFKVLLATLKLNFFVYASICYVAIKQSYKKLCYAFTGIIHNQIMIALLTCMCTSEICSMYYNNYNIELFCQC